MITRKRGLAALAVAAAVAGGAVVAQQSRVPEKRSQLGVQARRPGKHHTLAATLETVQWGWLDPERAAQAHRQFRRYGLDRDHDALARPDTARHRRWNKIVELRKANPGGGPHSMTGPDLRERSGAR